MVTRREMMKAVAIGSTMLGSVLVPLLSASAALAEEPEGAAGGQASPGGGIKITKILEQNLPDGKQVTIVTVLFPPGVEEDPHRHPGPVFGYVLEGALATQVEPGHVVTYKQGQAWYEPPLHIHRVARSASKTRPAKILALLIHEKNEALVLPA
jgi:quercetin dioxygenase-like cupin family protein